ncbi:MAG: iron-containing alcohol dehydrogenase [Candidatus Heimdallarchaeota archaeon]|nr:MAG: iron-containing alcohol dehydrogenase [Candidatus Heimdallarchaeota archaeon]
MPESEILESVVPRSIIIGKSTIKRIPDIIESLGLKQKIMILTGPRTRYVVGEEIYNVVTSQGMDCEVIIIENASLEAAKSYVDLAEQYKPNVIISAGGGKNIDVGKYCLKQISRKVEMISVPTSTSHDGLASPFIFLNDPTDKFIGECRPPIAVIADVEKILNHPDLVRYIAAGVGDTVGKITAIWDWRHAWRIKSEKFSRFVGGVLENADTLFQSQVSEALIDPEHAVQVVLKALLIAGVLMGTSNNIRVGYGSEHMFSAALDAQTSNADILHGERIALGAIMMAKLQGQNHEKLVNILKNAGCPTNIEDLKVDIPPEAIVAALHRAHKTNSMYTVLGQTGLTKEAALNIAQITGVISELHK